jgi:tetraacyldisaccharide-1-P 4'-kinase
MTFRDHHLYGARDLARIVTAAKAAGSAIVLTTEKDAVRLATLNLDDLPLASLPLVAGVQPEERFRAWLLERLRAARTSRQPSASARPMDAASYGGQPR